jgi:hypothetical protein
VGGGFWVAPPLQIVGARTGIGIDNGGQSEGDDVTNSISEDGTLGSIDDRVRFALNVKALPRIVIISQDIEHSLLSGVERWNGVAQNLVVEAARLAHREQRG